MDEVEDLLATKLRMAIWREVLDFLFDATLAYINDGMGHEEAQSKAYDLLRFRYNQQYDKLTEAGEDVWTI